MKAFRTTLSFPIVGVMLIVLVTLVACKKSGGGDKPPAANPSACTPTGEATNLPGNDASWQYQYNDKGQVTKIIKLNRYNQEELSILVQANQVTRNQGGNIVRTAYSSSIYETLPAQAQTSITLSGGSEQTNYYTYNFTYDSKKRLSKIIENTATVPNDREWALDITYNDKDNVTKLQYSWTTHPNEPVVPITVAAYDDKPSPYAAIPYWKFLLSNFAWDNYDPEPVLTVLSRNNPLDYTMLAGTPAVFNRTMKYMYNDKGFPTERANTNKNINGEVNFKQTFTYNCK